MDFFRISLECFNCFLDENGLSYRYYKYYQLNVLRILRRVGKWTV